MFNAVVVAALVAAVPRSEDPATGFVIDLSKLEGASSCWCRPAPLAEAFPCTNVAGFCEAMANAKSGGRRLGLAIVELKDARAMLQVEAVAMPGAGRATREHLEDFVRGVRQGAQKAMPLQAASAPLVHLEPSLGATVARFDMHVVEASPTSLGEIRTWLFGVDDELIMAQVFTSQAGFAQLEARDDEFRSLFKNPRADERFGGDRAFEMGRLFGRSIVYVGAVIGVIVLVVNSLRRKRPSPTPPAP